MSSSTPAHDSGPDSGLDSGPDSARTTPRQWAAVTMLSLSTFLVVTSEMLPVGVLTPMAGSLGIAPGTAGFSLTVTGLMAAVTAPVVPRVLGALDRRTVLAAALVMLAASNALTAAAHGVGLLMLSRLALGVGMGTVWGLAAAVAARLVAPRSAALAVTYALSGVAAASVVGVPLGTFAGNAFGWRAAFGTLTGASAALAVALLLVLPRLTRPAAPAGASGGAPREPLLRTAPVAAGLVLIVFLVTAHFAAYTYVRPVLEQRAGMAGTTLAALLLVYGLFGLLGNFAAGALAAHRARATVLALAAGIGGAVALLAVFGTLAAVAGLAVALWGLAYGGVSVSGQLWMTQSAPERTEHVTGLYVGVFTGAIALGSFVGGTVVEAAGITPLLWTATALAAAALATGLLGRGPSRPASAPATAPAAAPVDDSAPQADGPAEAPPGRVTC